MKKLLLGLLLASISMSASANLTNDQKEVIRAIDETLLKGNLKCTESVSGGEYPSSRVLITRYLKSNVKMNIDENNQPSIQFVGTYSSEISVDVKITTSDNFIDIQEMSIAITQNYPGIETNHGTLTRPNFQKKSYTKTIADYLCR